MTIRRERTDLHHCAVPQLDQKLWCWGRDIARSEANVLLGIGMCGIALPTQGPDRTAYPGQ